MGKPKHKGAHLPKSPRRITPSEPCAKNPIQVRVAESHYDKWMGLPMELRNKILREAIAKAIGENVAS